MPEQSASSQPTNWWRGLWRQRCGSRYASERGLKSGTDCACLIRALHSPRPGGLAFKAGWRECVCARTHTHTHTHTHTPLTKLLTLFLSNIWTDNLFCRGSPKMCSWLLLPPLVLPVSFSSLVCLGPVVLSWFCFRSQTVYITSGDDTTLYKNWKWNKYVLKVAM